MIRPSVLFIVLICVSKLLFGQSPAKNIDAKSSEWTDLLNYKDFSNWNIIVAIPPKKVDTEDQMVDSANHYLAPKGYISKYPNESVFTYQKIENKIMLVISGELIGFLTTKNAYQNYHLKMKFRFGKKWKWLGQRPRDGGIFYPMTEKNGREFNIHDGDIGSYWSFGAIADIPCQKSNKIPESIKVITPMIKHIIPSLRDSMYLYNSTGSVETFSDEIPEHQICIANPIADNALGEWNELELLCLGDSAIHIVNGKVVMSTYNNRIKKGDKFEPLISSPITFQSEGGEMFVSFIKLKQINNIR